MPDNEISDAAREAANWWAKAVGAPTFDISSRREEAAERMNLAMAEAMAGMIADRHPVSEVAGQKFAELLAEKIQAKLDRLVEVFCDTERRTFSYCLAVDYGPELTLADSAQQAGIDRSRFPWKTNMWIKPDVVTVSAGYGAGQVLVWASEEWLANRPLCSSQKWDEKRPYSDDYHGEPWQCSLPIYHTAEHLYDRRLPMCVECGRPDDWTHDEEQYGHMSSFHGAFVGA